MKYLNEKHIKQLGIDWNQSIDVIRDAVHILGKPDVSLRDYKADIFNCIKDAVIVDDWDEVCRQNTDIENMHKAKNLQKGDVKSIVDVVLNDCMENYKKDQPIMFNPMGMAVFDMALGSYYFKKASQYSVSMELE